MTEYVYIVKSNNMAKIGRTNDITARLDSYFTHNPFVQCAYVRPVEDSELAENYFLNYFSDKRNPGNRDWFQLTDNDIQLFIETKIEEFEHKVINKQNKGFNQEGIENDRVLEMLGEIDAEINYGKLCQLLVNRFGCTQRHARSTVANMELSNLLKYKVGNKGAKIYYRDGKNA